MTGRRLVHVLACGETYRSDDAVGLIAVRRLSHEVASLATIAEVGQLSVEVLLAVPRDAQVVVVDAVAGVPAGHLVRIPLATLTRGQSAARPASTHALPALEVLALADELRGRALAGTFIGLGGAAFGMGDELSAPAAAAMDDFTAAIEREIRRLGGSRSAVPAAE